MTRRLARVRSHLGGAKASGICVSQGLALVIRKLLTDILRVDLIVAHKLLILQHQLLLFLFVRHHAYIQLFK